jgi:hypothetical protein
MERQGGAAGTTKPFNKQSSFAFEPLQLWSKYHVADSLRYALPTPLKRGGGWRGVWREATCVHRDVHGCLRPGASCVWTRFSWLQHQPPPPVWALTNQTHELQEQLSYAASDDELEAVGPQPP